MFKEFKEEIELDGKKLILETGKIARQADGAIIATCGETVVISTVVGAKKVNPDTDYFPLQVYLRKHNICQNPGEQGGFLFYGGFLLEIVLIGWHPDSTVFFPQAIGKY